MQLRKNVGKNDANVMHQLDQVENFFNMESLKEKDLLLFQKLVQDSLKSHNFLVLIKLFQRFPKRMKIYAVQTRQIINENYLMAFKRNNLKISIGNIVDLDLEMEIACSASTTSLQGCLDNIVFIIQSCCICVRDYKADITCDYQQYLIRECMDDDYKVQLEKMLELFYFYCFKIIPRITRSSRYKNVVVDINQFFNVLFQVFQLSRFSHKSDPQRDPQDFEMLLENLEFFYSGLLNVMKELVIRFRGKLSSFSVNIYEILEKGLEKASIEMRKEIYQVLASTIEHISCFSNLDLAHLMEMMRSDWNLKLELPTQTVTTDKSHSTKKRRITIEKLESPYDALKQHLPVRIQLVNVFYHLAKYDSTFFDNHDMIAYILQDLLQMRINHMDDGYEEYHITLLKCTTEILISNYPKHIFPIILHCLKKAYYSQHLHIKAISEIGLRVCESIVHSHSKVPGSFDLPPLKRDTSNSDLLPVTDDGVPESGIYANKKVEQSALGDGSISEVDENGTIGQKAVSVFTPQEKPLMKESIPYTNLPPADIVLESDVNKEENTGSNYISLEINEEVAEEKEAFKLPEVTVDKETLKTPEISFVSKQKAASEEPNQARVGLLDSSNAAMDLNDSEESDVSESFSIPEINIDSSDDDE